jgi:glyoxylase-like metal-dependent hydrolase (beta-lactamase superfamily II)
MSRIGIIAGVALLGAVLVPAPVSEAQDFSGVEIGVQELRGSVRMLTGAGGNLGVSSGEDGVFLIDDQFAPLSDKIRAAIATFSEEPVRFVLNTHWHGDHTGGNESFGKSGAVIVAHENVRKRMSAEQFMETFQRKVPAAPKDALPIVTFTESVKFHLNGDTIHVKHVDPAHTDGDSIVFFEKANVLHTGDLFFNGRYPFIDLSSGGSVDGVIAAADTAIALCDDETKIIPGHGELATKADYQAYRDVLKQIRDRVKKLIDEGKTQDEVLAAKPTAEWDETWGVGFMRPNVFVSIVYDSLKPKTEK